MGSAALKSIKSLAHLPVGQVLSIKSWITKNPTEALILLVILLLGAFLRLYRIDEYMTFLGDEGRDAIIVRNLLVKADPILVGPGTSIGQMYLGPLYYYMMAPALFLAGYSPVGPSIQIALLGVLTIFFIWYAVRRWFPVPDAQSRTLYVGALAAAALYAVSPTAIIFSRSSWNPNVMPFFALLTIWSIWKAYSEQKYKWLIVLGISYAFVLNSHYLGLLLFPVIFTYGIFICKCAKEQKSGKELAKYIIYGIGIFLLLMSPLLIFDMRHNFQNFKAMQEFITHRDSSFKTFGEAVGNISMVNTNMFTRLVAGRNEMVGLLTAILATASLIYITVVKRKKVTAALKLVILWVVLGVVGLAFVEREIYDHYMGFLFPAPFLLVGWSVNQFVSNRSVGKPVFRFISLSVITVLVAVNLANSPLKDNPSRQLQRGVLVAQKIFDEAKGQRFNLAVLAERNYEDGYKYFLELWDTEVLHADRWDQNSISDQLFVVCEKPKDECDPTHDPKAEIVNFGWTKVENEWEVGGVVLYKLAHNDPK